MSPLRQICFFLSTEQIQESSEPAFAELRFQQARCPSGEISPGPSLEVAGVGEVLELAPLAGSELGPGSDPRRSSQSARAPWWPDPGAGARRPRDSGDPPPPTLQGRPHPEVILSNISPCVPAPTLPSLPKLLCPLAPRPVLRACSRAAVLASERTARSASAAAHFVPFPGPGDCGAAGGPRGSRRSEQLSALLARKRPARAD